MSIDTTSIYWLTLEELETLHYHIINAIGSHHDEEILHRIQSEISVVGTREENSIMPSDHIATIMDLPDHAIPIRLSFIEVATIKKLDLPESLAERFQ